MRLWLRVAAIVVMLGTSARADTDDWDQFVDHGGPTPKNVTPAPTSAPAKVAPKREARAAKAKTSKAKAKRGVKPKRKRR